MPRQIALSSKNPHRIAAFIDYAYDTEAMNFRSEKELLGKGRGYIFQAVTVAPPDYPADVIKAVVDGFNDEWKSMMGHEEDTMSLPPSDNWRED